MQMSNPIPRAPATCGIEPLEELTEALTPSPSTWLPQPYSALEPNNRPHAWASTVPLPATEDVTPPSIYAKELKMRNPDRRRPAPNRRRERTRCMRAHRSRSHPHPLPKGAAWRSWNSIFHRDRQCRTQRWRAARGPADPQWP